MVAWIRRRGRARWLVAACAALACLVQLTSEAEASPKKAAKKTATAPSKKVHGKTGKRRAPKPPEPPPEEEPSAEPAEEPHAAPVTAAASAEPAVVVEPIAVDKPPAAQPLPVSPALPPGRVDLKATLNADALLAFIGVGGAADVGIVRAGPGTFALGAGGEYDFCASICWLLDAVTPMDFSQSHVSLWGRASYHLALRSKSLEKIDLYPVVMVGPAFAHSSIALDDGSAEYRGTGRSIAFAGGLGANIFVSGPLFIGGEARVRYAQGVYHYELVAGRDQQRILEGDVATWSLTGIDVLFAMGVRIP